MTEDHFDDRKSMPALASDRQPETARATGTSLAPVRPKRLTTSARPRWSADLLRDSKGRVLAELANAMTALRAAPELAECFGFDEMLAATVMMQRLPKVADGVDDAGPFPRPVRDADVTQLQEWLQRAGLDRIGRDTCHQAVDLRARERAFHPVRAYLDGLSWDGEPRLGHWLSAYAGAEATAYHNGIGRMVLISMVARIFVPGCKSDHMVVLEGEQGARKSTLCRTLGGDYFSDSMPDVTIGKDVSQHLKGKWLVEIPEMSAMSRAENAALKAFITRQVEQYRPSYGVREVVEPRQCVFIGTTNKSTYLRDETGGRRFWPVKAGTIDIAALAADRDQLFAEAVDAYRSGEAWWPTAEFERLHIAAEQDARFETDAWEANIREYLAGRTSVLVKSIARDALHMETPKIGRADQGRITSILERLQWVRLKKDGNGNIPWGPS